MVVTYLFYSAPIDFKGVQIQHLNIGKVHQTYPESETSMFSSITSPCEKKNKKKSAKNNAVC